MSTVSEILGDKGSNVLRIDAGATVFEAVQQMVEANVGSLLVTDGGEIAGIVTERDYARKIVLMDRSSKTTAVRDIMTPHVRFVEPQQTTYDCMALMTERRMRHLPVMDGGKLVGMVSIGDLVKEIIAEQQFTIEQLEHYITGGTGAT